MIKYKCEICEKLYLSFDEGYECCQEEYVQLSFDWPPINQEDWCA